MQPLKPETIAAIQADEFAAKTIEAARAFIYGNFRDFSRITKGDGIPFKDDDAEVGYAALGMLLGKLPTDKPDLTGYKVGTGSGGAMMPIEAFEALETSFRQSQARG